MRCAVVRFRSQFLLKQCCDLLLAGGYFRARIPTLSPFDKVVGGIVWALTISASQVRARSAAPRRPSSSLLLRWLVLIRRVRCGVAVGAG